MSRNVNSTVHSGVYIYLDPSVRPSVRSSVRPSVRPSVRDPPTIYLYTYARARTPTRAHTHKCVCVHCVSCKVLRCSKENIHSLVVSINNSIRVY